MSLNPKPPVLHYVTGIVYPFSEEEFRQDIENKTDNQTNFVQKLTNGCWKFS